MLMLQYSKHGECILKEIGAAFRGEHPADLIIVCENKVKLHAHKLVLAAASPLLRSLLEETQLSDCATTVFFPDVNATYFKFLLDFLYSGQTCITSRDVSYLHDLLLLLQIKSDNWKTSDPFLNKCNSIRGRLNSEEKTFKDTYSTLDNKSFKTENQSVSGVNHLLENSEEAKSKQQISYSLVTSDENKNLEETCESDVSNDNVKSANNGAQALNPVNLSLGIRTLDDNDTKSSNERKYKIKEAMSSAEGSEKMKRKVFFFDSEKEEIKALVELPELNNSTDNYVVTPHRKRRSGFHKVSDNKPSFSYQQSLMEELNPTKTFLSNYSTDRKLLSPFEEHIIQTGDIMEKNRKLLDSDKGRLGSPDEQMLLNSEPFIYQWQSAQNTVISNLSAFQPELSNISEFNLSLEARKGEKCSTIKSITSKPANHCNINNGVREYRCEYCGKQFGMSWNLKTHLRVHTGEKPFACRLCVAMFKQKAHLLKHLCSVHRNIITTSTDADSENRYNCCFCSMYFESIQDLVRHLSGHHNNLLLTKNLRE